MIPSITYPTFEGYILTDITGLTIGIEGNETSDWTLDSTNWLQVEKNLFTNYDNLVHNYNSDFNISLYNPYPNHTMKNVVWFF